MKKIAIIASISCLTLTALASQPSFNDRLSYAMGFESGKLFRLHKVFINPKAYCQGLSTSLHGINPIYSQKDMDAAIQQYQEQAIAAAQKAEKTAGLSNAAKGKAFLAANAKKPGVVTLKSGLQYKIIQKGHGAKPTLNDTVTVDYQGMLIDGKVFDSSYERHMPATFPVNGVIKGWQQGLQLMRPGAIWMFYIPSNLAYGPYGAGGIIGKNETLIFKVHLRKIDN